MSQRWRDAVGRLQRDVLALVEDHDLDAPSILKVMEGRDMKRTIVAATEEYQREATYGLLYYLLQAVGKERTGWMRHDLKIVEKGCESALCEYAEREDRAREDSLGSEDALAQAREDAGVSS